MVNKSEAIKVEYVYYREHSRVATYTFKCRGTDCDKVIRVQTGHLKKSTGMCMSCSQKGEPFRAKYNELFKGCRGREIEVSLTFPEFREFTKQNYCIYCDREIIWHPHTRDRNHQRVSRSYNLDRKDNSIGYTKDNCVVCCWTCNQMKSDEFTYEEFMLLSPALKQIVKFRK